MGCSAYPRPSSGLAISDTTGKGVGLGGCALHVGVRVREGYAGGGTRAPTSLRAPGRVCPRGPVRGPVSFQPEI